MNALTNIRLLSTLALAAFFGAGIGPGASGQELANRLRTNLPGATTSAAPPEWFDYSTASDADLARYGLPPRPNEFTEPAAHASWIRALAASRQRIVPRLEQTNRFHMPQGTIADSSGTSTNWSAVVTSGGAQTYNNSTSFHYIFAEYVVPVATQAYGTCTGGWAYSSSWVGIDGYGSSDVLQAGTASDAYCNRGVRATSYSAWYEWYPYGSVQIGNFAVAPGDDIYIGVWNTSSTQGHVYFVNLTTNQAGELTFTAPPGTSLVGNSAEWVVERPYVNGGLSTLTNYISDYFSACTATTWGGTTVEPGSSSVVLVTMLDASGKPISVPVVLGQYAIWFQDEGSAR
jgi:hypothetical protein